MIALFAAAALTVAVAADQTAIRTAEGAVADTLKDPFSAHFTHVIVVKAKGSKETNVCGFAYAKNGNGVYNGRQPFLVGLVDGKYSGLLWGEDEGVVDEFGDDFENICDRPISGLQNEINLRLASKKIAKAQEEAARMSEAKIYQAWGMMCISRFPLMDYSVCYSCARDIEAYCNDNPSDNSYEHSVDVIKCLKKMSETISGQCKDRIR